MEYVTIGIIIFVAIIVIILLFWGGELIIDALPICNTDDLKDIIKGLIICIIISGLTSFIFYLWSTLN